VCERGRERAWASCDEVATARGSDRTTGSGERARTTRRGEHEGRVRGGEPLVGGERRGRGGGGDCRGKGDHRTGDEDWRRGERARLCDGCTATIRECPCACELYVRPRSRVIEQGGSGLRTLGGCTADA
jgi:hypothetical protein